MVQTITKSQAVALYREEVQRQYNASSPVDRVKKRFVAPVVGGRQAVLSLTDLLRELTNNSMVGQTLAVQYAQSLKDKSGSSLYLVS